MTLPLGSSLPSAHLPGVDSGKACTDASAACSGIFFDASISRCFLKAVHPAVWTFIPGEEGDATDLIGGCEMWSGVVNAEMDKICCVD